MRASVLFVLALSAATAQAAFPAPRPKKLFGLSTTVRSMNPFVTHKSTVQRARSLHGLSTATPLLSHSHRLIKNSLASLQATTGSCASEGAKYAAMEATCSKALDFDQQMTAADRQSALCGADKCIATLRNVLRACKSEITDDADNDSLQGLKILSVILNGMGSLCPANGKPGCFDAAASYEADISALEDPSGDDAAVQTSIGRVCGSECTKKILALYLAITQSLGDEDAIEEAQTHIQAQRAICIKGTDNRYCYPDVHKFFEDGQEEDLEVPSKVCPNVCARKVFLALMKAYGDAQTRDDFAGYFKFLCIKKQGSYCFEEFKKIFDDGEDGDSCPDGEAIGLECGKNAAATVPDCTDAFIGDELNLAMSCACANAIVECQKQKIPAKCLTGYPAGCRSTLTTCTTACDNYGISEASPAATSASSDDGDDECDGLFDGQCPADCKTTVTTVAESLGCCIPAMVETLSKVSADGEFGELHGISEIFKAGNSACDLGLKFDGTQTCQKLGKVKGKLAIKGISKEKVDANKDKFYEEFAKDLSTNVGVSEEDVTVTGHEAIEGDAQRLAALQSSGVKFDYEIATEDADSADKMEAELQSDIQNGNLELPATSAEIAKTDPGAEASVDSQASSVETVTVTPTPDPDASPSSGAGTVTFSAIAVTLGFIAALI